MVSWANAVLIWAFVASLNFSSPAEANPAKEPTFISNRRGKRVELDEHSTIETTVKNTSTTRGILTYHHLTSSTYFPDNESTTMSTTFIPVSPTKTPEDILDGYRELLERGCNFTDNLLDMLADGPYTSKICKTHANFLRFPAGAEQTLDVLDSMAKVPSGLGEGNFIWLGSFQTCIDMAYNPNSTSTSMTEGFVGQYCLSSVARSSFNMSDYYKFSTPFLAANSKDIPIRVGICFPSTCNASELEWGLTEMFKDRKYDFKISVDKRECQVKAAVNASMDTTSEWAFCFFQIVIAIIVTSTVLDCIKIHTVVSYPTLKSAFDWIRNSLVVKCRKLNAVVDAFSIRPNIEHLTHTVTPRTEHYFPFLDGLRVLSMFLVILGHTYSTSTVTLSWDNLNNYFDMRFQFFGQILISGLFAVDNFLFVTGFLEGYRGLRALENWPMGQETQMKVLGSVRFYSLATSLRIARLTFPYFASIIFTGGILQHLSSGPRWGEIVQQANNCRKNWYLNLLYISNFVDMDNMCQPHCWYLAVDVQLAFISTLVVIMYYWNRLSGILASAVLLATSAVVTFFIGIEHGYPAGPIEADTEPEALHGFYQQVYIKPYCRAIPLFAGLLASFYVHSQLRNGVLVENFWTTKKCIAWYVIGACCLCAWPIVTYVAFHHQLTKISAINTAAYAVWSKIIWSLGLGLILISAISQKGIVNNFMGWRWFQILGKLTFCTYIIHYDLLMVFFSSRMSTMSFDHWMTLNLFFGITLFSFSVGAVMYIAFDRPIIVLIKKLNFGRNEPTPANVMDGEGQEFANPSFAEEEALLQAAGAASQASRSPRPGPSGVKREVAPLAPPEDSSSHPSSSSTPSSGSSVEEFSAEGCTTGGEMTTTGETNVEDTTTSASKTRSTEEITSPSASELPESTPEK